MSDRPPYVSDAAIAHGPAAFALAKAVGPDELHDGLRRAGLHDSRWADLATSLLEAIDRAGQAWRAEAQQRREAAPGSSEVPSDAEDGDSEAMGSRVSVDQAAAALGITQRRCRQLLAAGDLDGERLGWAWTVDAASLDREIERRRDDQ